MIHRCCGQPLTYNKEADSYSCANCNGYIAGKVVRASEEPSTPAPEVLDNIANITGEGRRPGESDEELRARLQADRDFVAQTPADDGLTNAVLRKMVLDRDKVLHRLEKKIGRLTIKPDDLDHLMNVVESAFKIDCSSEFVDAMGAKVAGKVEELRGVLNTLVDDIMKEQE